jgi:hypothetical protein
VRGLAEMITTERFFRCAVTPTSARKNRKEQHFCTVSALSTRRGKNVKIPETSLNIFYLGDRKPPQKGHSTEPGHFLPRRLYFSFDFCNFNATVNPRYFSAILYLRGFHLKRCIHFIFFITHIKPQLPTFRNHRVTVSQI